MATTFGNRVNVETREQYETLVAWATSLEGWWDPERGVGQVVFATNQQAQVARACL
jgi:hypothetical protein